MTIKIHGRPINKLSSYTKRQLGSEIQLGNNSCLSTFTCFPTEPQFKCFNLFSKSRDIYMHRNFWYRKIINNNIFPGLDLHELYLENLPRLEYVRPNTFTPLQNLKKLTLANNIKLKVIDGEAFDQNQKLYEVSTYMRYIVIYALPSQ